MMDEYRAINDFVFGFDFEFGLQKIPNKINSFISYSNTKSLKK